jgi:NTP pyrophosphatase (non-canonical NTP hydrolase)
MKKCKSANRYKGIRPPRCNGGNPCDTCKAKYKEASPVPAFMFEQNELLRDLPFRRVASSKMAWKPGAEYKAGDIVRYNPGKGYSLKAVKSYFGGEITARQKKAHEKKLANILRGAEKFSLSTANVMDQYRAFVAFSGKQRKPYATGSEKIDQRFLSALGLAGEAGEVANLVKKIMFRSKAGARKLPKELRDKLLAELGDTFWYFMLVLIAFGIDFKEVPMGNMRKLVARGR